MIGLSWRRIPEALLCTVTYQLFTFMGPPWWSRPTVHYGHRWTGPLSGDDLSAYPLEHLRGPEADSSAGTPTEVEGGQSAPPSARKRRAPSANKSTRRKS
jgi:hypothetical protein